MIFAIYRIDRPDVASGRDLNRAAHLAYLEPFESAILCAGALWSEEEGNDRGGNAGNARREIGSLYLVSFETESEARAFALNDPFHLAGLFATVEVGLFKARTGTRKWALEI
jgi:uncharacterized protein